MARFQTLLLDLDDTVYPASSGLWEVIGDRINAFMIEVVGIESDQAAVLRRLYFERYGTSLNGLRLHHRVDPKAYLRYVHDVALEDYLSPDPDLRRMLESLARPAVIFTNSDSAHARRVLSVLGVSDLIDQIIDIIALEWVNKPQPAAYRRAMALCGQDDPSAFIVADDQFRNLVPASELGMGTVLVGSAERLDGVDHAIRRASELLSVVPELARA